MPRVVFSFLSCFAFSFLTNEQTNGTGGKGISFKQAKSRKEAERGRNQSKASERDQLLFLSRQSTSIPLLFFSSQRSASTCCPVLRQSPRRERENHAICTFVTPPATAPTSPHFLDDLHVCVYVCIVCVSGSERVGE